MAHAAPDIIFEELKYTVHNRKGKRTLLNKISGTFPSGKLIAILGPSGAGKTTLLNTLSGWNHHCAISGRIKVDNKERKLRDFKSISCYITQDTYLVDNLSVQENFKYAADLKLGRSVSQSYKSKIIFDIANNFGLTPHMETATGKLSGGQRKRLAISLELLNSPDIMFLDEPTTGLDIVSVSQCVRYLKQLSENGKSVICTMHQPPGNVVKMFDIVYIVANGQCVYQGGPDELVTFLEDNGVPCGLYHSPIDYIIELANGEYGTKIVYSMVETSKNGKNNAYMAPLKIRDTPSLKRKTNRGKTQNMYAKWSDYSLYDDWYEFKTIAMREITLSKRDLYMTYLRLFGIIANSVMIGCVCYNLGADNSLIYFNYNMVLLHISMLTLVFAITSAVSFVQAQRIIRNEYENGYYSLRNYYLSNLLKNLPVSIISVTLGTFIMYYLSGQLMTFQRLSMFTVLSIALSMIADGVGSIAGSIFDTAEALFVATAIHIPIYVVSGYGLTILDMPRPFYYASNLAYTRFGVRSMMATIMGYDRLPTECPEAVTYCHYRDSIKFLNEMGLEDYYFVYDVFALAMFYVAYQLLTYFIIRYRLKNGIYAGIM